MIRTAKTGTQRTLAAILCIIAGSLSLYGIVMLAVASAF
jgi:hypothetical protein